MREEGGTRAKILDVCRTLFNERGPVEVTTAEIAQAAGISEGNLHYHFRRKTEIIVALFEEFRAAVHVHPEILECHMVAGGFDYLVKTRVADMDAFRQFAGTVLWQLPGVRETRTYAVMEEVKNTTHIKLD